MERFENATPDKYKVIFEGSKVGVWEWPNVNEDALFWSHRMSDILGLDHATYKPLLSTYFDFVFPEDREMLQNCITQHLENDVEFSVEYRIVHPSGEIKWVQGSGQALRHEDGTAYSMYGIIQDINERKQAEKQTIETLAFLNSAEDIAKIGSFKWDPESNELWFSKGARKLFDIGDDEVLTFDLFMSKVVPEDRPSLNEQIRTDSSNQDRIIVKYRIFTTVEKHIEGRSEYYFDNYTGSAYYMGIVQDRTEHTKKEIQVQELIANLQRSNADLEQFAYVASHDLQEPLRKIQTFGERLLQRSDALPEKDRLYVQRMENAAHRMQNLISDLLDFSRASRVKDISENIDLNDVFQTIHTDLEAKIERNNAQVQIDKMPTITGNSGQLYRLFLNLISNAIKFHKEDEYPIVNVSADIVSRDFLMKEGIEDAIYLKYHRISIKDNGIGFELEYLNKIFTLFQRLHGKSEFEGTGIGLAICRKIAANHGGYVTATSEVGIGSTFFVFLPKHHNRKT